MTSTTKQTQVLLLGAGELGTAFLTSITSLPHTHVMVGVRTPSKHIHLASSITNLTAIDLASPSSTLIDHFAAYDIIISATGFASSSGSMTKLATEVLAAGRLRAQRGEPRVWFFPWQWGVDYDVTGDGNGLMPLFGEQKVVRDLLRAQAEESNAVWTIMSVGIFMSFLFESFWGIVNRDGEDKGEFTVRCLKDWEHGVTVTDVADIGRVLARVLTGEVDAENRVLYVAGDSVQYGRLADVVERAVGRKVAREVWDVEYLREELKKDPDNGIKKYRLVFSGDGVLWGVEGTVNNQLGMEMTDVETYAEKLYSIQK